MSISRSLRALAVANVLLLCATASFGYNFFSLGVDPGCTGSKPYNTLSWAPGDPPPYTVYRDGAIIGQANTIRYDDTGVAPGARYVYWVTTKSVTGVISTSRQVEVVTLLCNRPPGTTLLTATEICNTAVTPPRAGVHLSWAAATNAESYDVVRDGGYVVVATGVLGLSVDDLSPLTVGQTYSYAVFIKTSQSGVNVSNQPLITISSSACPAPPEAFTLSSAAACDVVPATPVPMITLNWTPSLNAKTYQVLRDGALYAASASTPYIDHNVVAGKTYAYRVRAVNNSGSLDSNAITTAINADICHLPPGPFTIQLNPGCWRGPYVSIALSPSKFVTSYVFLRDKGRFPSWTLPGSATGIEDEYIELDQTYRYSVRAVNDYGFFETVASVTVPASLCTPAAPAWLSLQALCQGGVPLVRAGWDPSRFITGYQLLRNGAPVSPTLPAGVTTFDDHSAIAGDHYEYVVRASNQYGSADSASSAISVADAICPVPPQVFNVVASSLCDTAPKVRLDWAFPPNARDFLIYRDGALIASLFDAKSGTFTDATVTAGQSHAYLVRASNEGNTLYQSQNLLVIVSACPVVPARHRGVRP
ncbi:MAG: hypothetical protein QOK37_3755 [Thermoanaerobaculia bacterium]|nr:hypothetical protein [Thermoanaerobaculia bacterium]